MIRLVAILPIADAQQPRFRRWRSERTSGRTVTLSLGFDDVAIATATARALPYVWHLEQPRE